MGERAGRLRASILELLKRQERMARRPPSTVSGPTPDSFRWQDDIVRELFNAGKAEGEPWDRPSSSFDAAVDRALRTLARRGEIRMGLPPHLRGRRPGQRACWLPGAYGPGRSDPRWKGALVGQAILEYLASLTREEAEEIWGQVSAHSSRENRQLRRAPGSVPFYHLVGVLLRRFRVAHNDKVNFRVAAHRAVARLALDGAIVAGRHPHGERMYYVSVGLPRPANAPPPGP
jgi:hypothetical protein